MTKGIPMAASSVAPASAQLRLPPSQRLLSTARGAAARHKSARGYTWHCSRPRRKPLTVSAFSSSRDASSDEPEMTERRRILLKYVRDVQPQAMESFAEKAHPQVVDAMRQTVTNMLGTLPPQFFQVTISTVGENLAQLMYSVIMSGYMFRNAQYRMDLRNGLGKNILPAGPSLEAPESSSIEGSSTAAFSGGNPVGFLDDNGTKDGGGYAPGVQKKEISGEVVRWNNAKGAEKLPAKEYMEMLEREVTILREQVESRQRLDDASGNDLMRYLNTLEPQNLQDLTAHAGEDVLEAMNSFIQRLLGSSDPEELKEASNESSAAELARMLYWLMVVGYSLRTMEVRFDMESSLDLQAPNQPRGGLPPLGM